MSEFRYWSLSSRGDALRFVAFWAAFGLVGGPLVGFLFGTRTWAELARSIEAGFIFAFTLGLTIVAAHGFRQRLFRAGPAEGARAIAADAAYRLGVTFVATVVAGVVIDA